MNRKTSLHLFFITTASIALIAINIKPMGYEFRVPKHLSLKDTITENVLLFQGENEEKKLEKYILKAYSQKDMIVAELVASKIAQEANIQSPYVKQVPQDTLFTISETVHNINGLRQELKTLNYCPIEPVFTIHRYIEGETLKYNNPLNISIQHLHKPKHLNNITHHKDLAKIVGFNIFISDEDCHRGNVLKQQLNDDTISYWNIDTDFSFDNARDVLKDKWGTTLEELTDKVSQEDIMTIKSSLQNIGFAYTTHQYLSALKKTDLTEQHKTSLAIVNTILKNLIKRVPASTYSQLWIETTQSIDWKLKDVQKSIFTEMISANYNNMNKVMQEINRLTL